MVEDFFPEVTQSPISAAKRAKELAYNARLKIAENRGLQKVHEVRSSSPDEQPVKPPKTREEIMQKIEEMFKQDPLIQAGLKAAKQRREELANKKPYQKDEVAQKRHQRTERQMRGRPIPINPASRGIAK